MSQKKSHQISFQLVLAAVCVVLLSLVYLAAYVVAIELMRTPAPQLQQRAQVSRIAKMAYAPDVLPPPIQDGKAPVIYRIETQLPVVFLTIDDGVDRMPEAADTLRDLQVPASLFLVEHYAQRDTGYFAHVAATSGSVIENHTLDHKEMPKLSLADQKREICETSQSFERIYGKRPTLFRPPYGEFNDDTRRAAADCGIRAVVHWHALVENGGVHYQRDDRLFAGDIVLMHFKPTFRRDVEAFVNASKAAGLEPQLLEDWFWR